VPEKLEKNFKSFFLHSDKDSKYIHKLRDTPDKCTPEILNGCLEICYQTLKSIDLRVE
jgi:hypothetical protein